MLGFLLPSNIKATAIVIAAVAVFSAGWYVNGMRWEAKLKTALERQMIEMVAKCEEDKKLTEVLDNEQLQKISALSKQLSNTKRLYATKCNVPVADPASLNNAATRAGQPVRPNGVNTESLLDIAADGERYRLTLASCQDFVRKVWSR